MDNKNEFKLLNQKVTGIIKTEYQYVGKQVDATINPPIKNPVLDEPNTRNQNNHRKSFKISDDLYKNLAVIKSMNRNRFDYEVIQELVRTYYEQLSIVDQYRFNILKENI